MPDRNKIYDIASLRDYARYAYNVSNGAWLAQSVEHETLMKENRIGAVGLADYAGILSQWFPQAVLEPPVLLERFY